MKTVLLLGSGTDPHLKALEAACRQLGAPVLRLDSRSPSVAKALSWTPDGTGQVAATPLEHFGGAMLRALPPRLNLGTLTLPADGLVAREKLRQSLVQGAAGRDAWTAVFGALVAQSSVVLNPPHHGSVLEHKPSQLQAAEQVGLCIPRTCITADPELARQLGHQLRRQIILKPVRGGGAARAFLDDNQFADGPMLAQERVEGADVRVVILAGEVLCAARVVGATGVDYRADPNWPSDVGGYGSFVLNTGVAQKLTRLAKHLGLVFGAADLRVSGDAPEQATFLEFNGAPAWLDVEKALKTPLTSLLAAHLCGLN